MQELKDILPNHFEKVGFDYKKFVSLIEELDKFDENISFNLRYISYRNAGRELCTIDYATILTSKEYIDCLAEYIRGTFMPYHNLNRISVGYRILGIIIEYDDIKEYLIKQIGLAIYNGSEAITEFITNITKDE